MHRREWVSMWEGEWVGGRWVSEWVSVRVWEWMWEWERKKEREGVLARAIEGTQCRRDRDRREVEEWVWREREEPSWHINLSEDVDRFRRNCCSMFRTRSFNMTSATPLWWVPTVRCTSRRPHAVLWPNRWGYDRSHLSVGLLCIR